MLDSAPALGHTEGVQSRVVRVAALAKGERQEMTGGDTSDDAVARHRRRRRANVPGGRVYAHLVRVSEAEEAQLLARAAARQITVPRLLVEAALNDGSPLADATRRDALTALFSLQRVLAGAANNLNQIARALNAGGDPQPVQLNALLDQFRRLGLRIDEILGRL